MLFFQPQLPTHRPISKYSPKKIKKIRQLSKISKFRQKINFKINVGDYVVKTAETPEELTSALMLRHDIFIKEGLGVLSLPESLDFDKYDLLADHILLIKRDSQKLIGTYRVLSSSFCDSFYTGNEFYIEDFLNEKGIKLELGRACIHQDHRKSFAIHLIWKGLGRYASLIGAAKMFGCTSVKSNCKHRAQQYINYLKPNFHSDQYNIRVRSKYSSFQQKQDYKILHLDEIKHSIPALMKSYMKAGAKFHGFPAYDSNLKTTDFFTVLDLKNLNEHYKKRYTVL